MTTTEIAAVAGLWAGFWFVMWATAKDESEKQWHLFILGGPALLLTGFGVYQSSQGFTAPGTEMAGLVAAGLGALGAWVFQDRRYKRT